MLEGTDLLAAYQTLSGTHQFDEAYELVPQKQEPEKPAAAATPTAAIATKQDNIALMNRHYENDQKLQALNTELKKKKEAVAPPAAPAEPSYLDKLFGKKKELYKILSLSLIITLGLSLHFLIDHYLTKYITEHELSFERQLILRLLYPIGVLFVLWNLRVFVK